MSLLAASMRHPPCQQHGPWCSAFGCKVCAAEALGVAGWRLLLGRLAAPQRLASSASVGGTSKGQHTVQAVQLLNQCMCPVLTPSAHDTSLQPGKRQGSPCMPLELCCRVLSSHPCALCHFCVGYEACKARVIVVKHVVCMSVLGALGHLQTWPDVLQQIPAAERFGWLVCACPHPSACLSQPLDALLLLCCLGSVSAGWAPGGRL
jgi:hypothetical protein